MEGRGVLPYAQKQNRAEQWQVPPPNTIRGSMWGFPWTCVIPQGVRIRYTQQKDPPCSGRILLVLEMLGFGGCSFVPPPTPSHPPAPDLGMSWHSALTAGLGLSFMQVLPTLLFFQRSHCIPGRCQLLPLGGDVWY